MALPNKTYKGNEKLWEGFLVAYEKNPITKRACEISGLSRDTLNKWLKSHPELRQRIQQIKTDSLEDGADIGIAALKKNAINSDTRAAIELIKINERHQDRLNPGGGFNLGSLDDVASSKTISQRLMMELLVQRPELKKIYRDEYYELLEKGDDRRIRKLLEETPIAMTNEGEENINDEDKQRIYGFKCLPWERLPGDNKQ